MLVEVMSTLLADEDVGHNEHENNLTLAAFTPGEGFRRRASRYADYIHAATPIDPDRPPLVPGEPEAANRRRATSVVVDATSWAAIVERAERKRVAVPSVRS
jgi:LDH2 family malate/lactate/ureidoglycolate dehydrogenase